MLHLGDITKISGYTAPITDCVVGGSPCQDLSVAGKRAGLEGERSGLFMEQIRIIKEMREQDVRNTGRSDDAIRPRYMVWENVPGAFSSNKGEDFRIVLEETARVKDKDASIPMPDKGKWTNAGCILGDGWSIAWRVLDAQFWGVPQRRRRIALVADFGGHSAPQILFVRKSVSMDTEPSQPKRETTTTDAARGIGADDCYGADVYNGDITQGKVNTLVAEGNNSTGFSPKVMTPMQLDSLGADQYNGVILGDSVSTLGVNCGMSHGRQCVLDPMSTAYSFYETWQESDTADKGGGKSACNVSEGQAPTLTCTHGGEPAVCYSFDSLDSNSMKSSNPYSGCRETEVSKCLDTTTPDPSKNQGGMAVVEVGAFYPQMKAESQCFRTDGISNCLVNGTNPGFQNGLAIASVDCRNGTEAEVNATLQMGAFRSLNCNNVVRTRYTVRRLTPLECERLQGYPDGWTDIGEWTDSNGKKKQSSDAARYKALGNSIALPPWKWVMKRLCACYERDATLASLFDGIGGFPYIWEQINGKGSCLWASEIDEFPMAVTKVRIGE